MIAPARSLLAVGFSFAISAPTQEPRPFPLPPAADRVLVCNQAEHTLSIFSARDREELARLPTGRGPHEVAVTPDGKLAVVSDYGDQQPGHSLTVVDIRAQQVLRTIELTQRDAPEKLYLRPHGIRCPGNEHAVVTSEAARQLLFVHLERGVVLRTLPTPQSTMHMVATTSDGWHAAASSIRDGSVVFFELHPKHPENHAGAAPRQPIATGDGAEGIAVHPVTGDAWVGNRSADTLSVVSRATREVVATLPTGRFPFRVAFAPDGSTVLVTCAESGELMCFDAATRAVRWRQPMQGEGQENSQPMGVAIDADGTFAYVTCGRSSDVAVVALADGSIVARMPARAGADGVACARLPPAEAPVVR